MRKGTQTKQQILSTALQLATASSLNDLTIGSLAIATGMSKSGLFAHFNSKENLQLAVLEHAQQVFRSIVSEPVRDISDPLTRLLAVCDNWLDWYEHQAKTCIYISAAVEFDDQPGAVHDKVQQDLAMWLKFLTKCVEAVIAGGQFKQGTDAQQFVFELYSLYLGSQSMPWLGLEDANHSRFKQALQNLIERYRGGVSHEQ
ncbi:TetR/AcrR family transcriptional regulator [Pseudoalteromonas fenneropenaei]|uniref:TetR/AcrR family transcriptional regulator n=1 Tax=Pseudoalteromonas fenneropenaei TaxID=1737459 RepID=A0ABV7CJS1_9GAMM